MSSEGSRIDPLCWTQFSTDLHAATDMCLDRMKGARDLPWIQKPEDMRQRVSLKDGDIEDGIAASDLYTKIQTDVMPYATGNTHPRFWVSDIGIEAISLGGWGVIGQ